MARSLARRIGGYFALELSRLERAAPVADGGNVPVAAQWQARDMAWLAAVYLAQVLGALAKQVYDDVSAGKNLHFPLASLLIAAIASAVSFPVVYRSLQQESHPGVRLFLAFQSGFFWKSILSNVTPA